MKFTEALEALMSGQSIENTGLGISKGTVFRYSNQYKTFQVKSDSSPDWKKALFEAGDILSNDWEIIEEEPKLYTFEEAIKAFREGKTIRRVCWHDIFLHKTPTFKGGRYAEIEDLLADDWIITEGETK